MWSFYKALFKSPSHMGAVAPSSKYLARAIANNVPIDNDSFIIELGPGTGVITKAIIDRGVNESQIIAIEKSPGLAKKLQRQFPLVNVLHGNAMDLNKLLGDSDKRVSAVVSSLPLLSLPKATVKIILEQIENILEPNGCYIQFTYGTKDNWHKMLTRLKKTHSKRVWINIPPATIFVYR